MPRVCFFASTGLQVQSEGNAAVVEALSEKGVLLKEEQYAHKYPYDWRTKKPTIFRATSQWFASVEGFRWVCGGLRGGMQGCGFILLPLQQIRIDLCNDCSA
jgi:isoleucyl-tRNA synthetase